MCGGLLVNFMIISAISNSFSVVGNIIFQLVIMKMRPWYYLTFIQNFLILLITVLLFLIYFPLGTVLNGIIFGVITVFLGILSNYDNNIINSVTPHQIMGLSFGILSPFFSFLFLSFPFFCFHSHISGLQGVLAPLFGLGAVLLATLQFKGWINITIIIIVHFVFLIYATCYGILQSRNIKLKLDDKERFATNSWYQTWVSGYGEYWSDLEKKEV
jgi:hypothetical protein